MSIDPSSTAATPSSPSTDDLLLAVPIQTMFGAMLFPGDCQVITPQVMQTGVWAAEEGLALQCVLRQGGWFLDVGAHVGFLSMVGARAVGDQGRVISIEPTPNTAELLRRNLSSLAPGIATVHEVAAWSSSGEGFMSIHTTNTGDNRAYAVDDGEHVKQVPIKRASLDELIGEDLERLDVIKIDVQGSEPQALSGMSDMISTHRPVILMEFWPHGIQAGGESPNDLLNYLRVLGYEIRLPGFTAAGDVDNDVALQVAVQAPGEHVWLILVPKP